MFLAYIFIKKWILSCYFARILSRSYKNFFLEPLLIFFLFFFNVDMNLIPYIFTIVLIIFYSHKFFLLNLLVPKVFLHCGVFFTRGQTFQQKSLNYFILIKLQAFNLLRNLKLASWQLFFECHWYRTDIRRAFHQSFFKRFSY